MYPNKVDEFTEKLNKLDNNTYTIEEEVNVKDGVYEGELKHDNISKSSIRVYTGAKLTDKKIENFILSTPSKTPWKTEIKIFSKADKIYITYQTQGDTVEAEDINKVQESIVNTQKALNSETDRAIKEEQNITDDLNEEINRAKTKENSIETNLNDYKESNNVEVQKLKKKNSELDNKKAEKTYIDTELSKKVNKVQGKELSAENYTLKEKQKLAEIEVRANKYIHPASHSANIIIENENKRFVSDTEKNKWNAKIGEGPLTWNDLKGV